MTTEPDELAMVNEQAALLMGYEREEASRGLHYDYWLKNGVAMWRIGTGQGSWSPATNIAQSFTLQAEIMRRGIARAPRQDNHEMELFSDAMREQCPKGMPLHWWFMLAPPLARTKAAIAALAQGGVRCDGSCFGQASPD